MKHKPEKKAEKLKQEPVNKPNRVTPLVMAWYAILFALACLFVYNKLHASDKGKTEEQIIADDEEAAQASPVFDLDNWLNCSYQKKYEDYMQKYERVGKEFVPLKNQLDYECYNKYNVEDYVEGNDGYIISEAGIFSYTGKNFLGDELIREKMRKLKLVSDSLKKRGTDVLVLFGPSKEYAMPQVIPSKYLDYKRQKTNYEAYIEQAGALGIHHINLLPIMYSLMKKYEYPIYPRYGTHPSTFAECLVVDTTIKYIERLTGIKMLHIGWDTVEYPAVARLRDDDALLKSNLLYPPAATGLAYPRVGYPQRDSALRVRVLGIGDSYYRSFHFLRAAKYAFYEAEFWYYYNSIVLEESTSDMEVWEQNLATKLLSSRVVILYYSSANLHRFGDGFIEDAYEMISSPETYNARINKERPLREKMKLIHNSPELLDEATATSRSMGITLDSAIRLQAIELASN